jgi:virginiamycin B lyase
VPKTGDVTEYNIPSPNASPSSPFAITIGTDGNLWFTEVGYDVGKISPKTGKIIEYPVTN